MNKFNNQVDIKIGWDFLLLLVHLGFITWNQRFLMQCMFMSTSHRYIRSQPSDTATQSDVDK